MFAEPLKFVGGKRGSCDDVGVEANRGFEGGREGAEVDGGGVEA